MKFFKKLLGHMLKDILKKNKKRATTRYFKCDECELSLTAIKLKGIKYKQK